MLPIKKDYNLLKAVKSQKKNQFLFENLNKKFRDQNKPGQLNFVQGKKDTTVTAKSICLLRAEDTSWSTFQPLLSTLYNLAHEKYLVSWFLVKLDVWTWFFVFYFREYTMSKLQRKSVAFLSRPFAGHMKVKVTQWCPALC